MTRNMTVLGVFGLSLALLAPQAKAADLKVGDQAPAFTMQGSDGKTHTLADYKGKQAIVIAWYPKAFTGGCTAECKSFREHSAEMKKMGVAYFTASVDTPELNKKFGESLDVDYPILSDPDKSVANAYGVINPARGMANRWTFYIDKTGVIREIDKKVNTKQAGPDVVKKVKELKLGD